MPSVKERAPKVVASDSEVQNLKVAIGFLHLATKSTDEGEFINLVMQGYREAHRVWHDRYLGVGEVGR